MRNTGTNSSQDMWNTRRYTRRRTLGGSTSTSIGKLVHISDSLLERVSRSNTAHHAFRPIDRECTNIVAHSGRTSSNGTEHCAFICPITAVGHIDPGFEHAHGCVHLTALVEGYLKKGSFCCSAPAQRRVITFPRRLRTSSSATWSRWQISRAGLMIGVRPTGRCRTQDGIEN